MKKLHKLLAKEYIFNLAIISFALTTTVFIFDLLEFADELINLKFIDILHFITLRIPYFISYTTLYSIVLASVLSLIGLSNSFELVALFSSSVSYKRVRSYFLILISITALLAFINEGFISPFCYRESMILIGKEKAFHEIELKDIAIKKDDGFFFIEVIENGGTMARNIVEVILDRTQNIKAVTVIPIAEKKSEDWYVPRAILYNDYGEKTELALIKKIEISDALINLAYRPRLLTLFELKQLLVFSGKYNLDIAKYSNYISKLIMHIFVPMLMFSIFFKTVPITADDKKRIVIAIKLILILIIYTIFESNIYNYAIVNKLNPIYPLIIIISLLLLSQKMVKENY